MTKEIDGRDELTIAYRIPMKSSKMASQLMSGQVSLCTQARALEGMQKEAIVQYGPTGTTWRLMCDEGPWLNGTDLAPFPLAYFASGLAASLMSDILAEAADRDICVNRFNLTMDNFFSMEGSALQGTMKAGVDPVELRLSVSGDATPPELVDIVDIALADRSACAVAMRSSLPSRFAVRLNGNAVEWPGLSAEAMREVTDPQSDFEDQLLSPPLREERPLIRKDQAVGENDGTGAVGLSDKQKRTVHVHSEATLRADGLKEIAVQCITPAGSKFVFLSDDPVDAGGQERAPCGLTYLSAGVSFCFMTQLGRYAEIAKQQLKSYRIVQNTSFRRGQPYDADAMNVETLVCLESENPVEDNLTLVQMGEQTCYLHGAFRDESEFRCEVDGARSSSRDPI